MHFGFKRWWSAPATSPTHRACSSAAAWASLRGHTFRSVSAEGFVVDGHLTEANPVGQEFNSDSGTSAAPVSAVGPAEPTSRPCQPATAPAPWRLEWGPSNRHYIAPHELRIRSEPVLDPELQLLVINRCLQEHMERSVFELFVEGVQTRIDTATPPEMRWLVLLPTVPSLELPGLGPEWVAVASHKAAMIQWLTGELAGALAQSGDDPQKPVVLMISRGRLSLRTELAETDLGSLQRWSHLFETALRAAQPVRTAAAPVATPALAGPAAVLADIA